MLLHFQHLRDTKNIGDRSCSPFDYFDWGDATVSDIQNADTPDYDIGIYGGGKIFGGFPTFEGVRRNPNALNIAWGVGTKPSFPLSPRYFRARRRMDIVGTRDYGHSNYLYAPCPSCMSPLFDAPSAPEHDVVFYTHGGKTAAMNLDIPGDMPTKDNNSDSLEEALRFIASGRTVISNSYHGVYWGLLLGRRVICVPFSNKFQSYRLNPHYGTRKTWKSEIKNAVAQPEMLELVRQATLDFKAVVDAEIDKRSR